MKILALVIFLIFIQFGAVLAENDSSIVTNRATISKIHPILSAWKIAENPEEFAKNNGLLYKDGKIQVYIHLTNADSLQQIPPEIKVIATDQNIAVAYVTSEQLDWFERLGFVEKLMPPDLARTSPTSIIENTKNEKIENMQVSYLQIIIGLIVIIAAVVITITIIHKNRSKKQASST